MPITWSKRSMESLLRPFLPHWNNKPYVTRYSFVLSISFFGRPLSGCSQDLRFSYPKGKEDGAPKETGSFQIKPLLSEVTALQVTIYHSSFCLILSVESKTVYVVTISVNWNNSTSFIESAMGRALINFTVMKVVQQVRLLWCETVFSS